jgi:hypothetical protein
LRCNGIRRLGPVIIRHYALPASCLVSPKRGHRFGISRLGYDAW